MDWRDGLPQELKIMIVDDHDLIRKSIVRILEKLGIKNPTECSSVAEAMTSMEATPFDLCIADLYLGKKSGFDLLTLVRQRETRADMPFLIVTGEGNKEDIVRAVDLGADEYLLKPFQPEELERKIIKLLTTYLKPTEFLHLIRTSERLLFGNEFAQALGLIERALKIEPESARAYHLKAIVLDKLNRSDEAVAVLQKNMERAPSFYKNYMSLADIELRRGHAIAAINALKQELEFNPKQTSRQNTLAKLLADSGDVLGAIDHYRIALRQTPHSRQSLFGMAKAFAALSNLEKSLYYLKRIRRHHPTDKAALQAMVKFAADAGQPRQAEFMLKDEKRSFPKRLDTYIVLAQFYMANDRWDEVEPVVNELIKVDANNTDGMKLQVTLLLRAGKVDEAIEKLKEVVAAAPEADSLWRLAELYIGKGRIHEATTTLLRCIRKKDCPPEAWDAIGKIYLGTEQFMKAHLIFLKMQKRLPLTARQEWLKKSRESLLLRRHNQRAVAS